MVLCIGLLLAMSLLAGCSQSREQKPQPASTKANSVSKPESMECVRGEPVALLEPDASEFRKIGKLEALETVKGDGSVEVRIRHFGCTAFALDFEIIWKAAPAKASEAAANVIRGLRVRESNKAVIHQIADAVKQLRNDDVQMSDTESLTVIPEPEPNKFRLRYELTL